MLILPHEHRAPFIAPGRRNRKVHWNRERSKAIQALGKFEREDWRRALWLPESLRQFEPRWNNQFSPSGDSCGCCGGGADPCAIFSDNFDRSDSGSLGAGWTEESGDFEISSNRLSYNSGSNAVAISTTSHSSHNVSITVDVRQGLLTGTTFRVVFSYVDTNNYCFVELKIGTSQPFRLVERSGGVDTELDSTTLTTAATGTYTIYACMSGPFFYATTSIGGELAASHTGSSGQFGVGIGAAGGPSAFDNFVVRAVEDGCENCTRPNCLVCEAADGLPDAVEMTIAGVANDSCSDCATLNGTFILSPQVEYCIYSYLGSFVCDYFGYFFFFGGAAGGGTSLEARIEHGVTPLRTIGYETIGVLSSVDCRNMVDYDIPWQTHGIECDGSSSTCKVTSL